MMTFTAKVAGMATANMRVRWLEISSERSAKALVRRALLTLSSILPTVFSMPSFSLSVMMSLLQVMASAAESFPANWTKGVPSLPRMRIDTMSESCISSLALVFRT